MAKMFMITLLVALCPTFALAAGHGGGGHGGGGHGGGNHGAAAHGGSARGSAGRGGSAHAGAGGGALRVGGNSGSRDMGAGRVKGRPTNAFKKHGSTNQNSKTDPKDDSSCASWGQSVC